MFCNNTSSSSIGTATLVMACSTIVEYSQQEGFYRVPLPAARQTPNLEDQWLERSNFRHQMSLTSKTKRANPSSGRWKYGQENCREFCRKWRLPRHFWVLLHVVNYDMGPTALLPLRRKARWGYFRPKNPTTSGYQRPARSPLDHRSRFCNNTSTYI